MANEKQEKKTPEIDVDAMVDNHVQKALKALEQFMDMTQEQMDKIVEAMTVAGQENHTRLAKMAVEETGRGVYEDKIIKNMFATEYIWHSIKNEKTVGIVEENELEGYVEIAEPVGVVAAATPVTNPTSTTMFKSLICMKSRNPVIFGFHPSAQQCSVEAAKVLYDAAVKAGAPENCIQWIETPSIQATTALMNHPGVSLILATGGAGMVRSAYSAGKPALGVGPGNVPCYIEKSAKLERACTDLMLSKTFDNGMICASEQAVIVDKELHKDFERIMKENNCYFLNAEETQKVSDYVINAQKQAVNPDVVGKSANWIAEHAGIKVPEKTKILIAKLPAVGPEYPLSREKLSPVLAYFVVNGVEEGFQRSLEMLHMGGLGHSAVIHSTNDDIIKAFGEEMKVGRVIVNSPSSQGGIGDIYNSNTPSLTLGCGSYGHNSTTSNVSTVNLINKKRLAKRRVNMQWFKIPPKIYFEEDSIQYLEKMQDIERAFIVTDPMMVKLGYVDKILYYLRKREHYCHSEIYSDVEPDPDVETIMRGVSVMREFQPDVIIALGGGSAMDAAKGMWLFYEHPDASFDGLKQKFIDIRKRAVKFPKLGTKAKMVCIPTTSGTGSEVTSFAVITDRKNGNVKYPLADYALTPDVAIIDPQFVMSLPKSATADTGMDVLTHALEAYVSKGANDFSDALCEKAVSLVFRFLPLAFQDGTNLLAREKMHNASCMAGLAFNSAGLGLNHGMAHAIGAKLHIAHGRINAMLLPHIITFNADLGRIRNGEYALAAKKYQRMAKVLDLPAPSVRLGVTNLLREVERLNRTLKIPASLKEWGAEPSKVKELRGEIVSAALADATTATNPRPAAAEHVEALLNKVMGG
mgnify:CR=1 FL=1